MTLEEIIQKTKPGEGVFNNAAQVWNHTFYWNSMSTDKSCTPEGDLLKQIENDFGSLDKLKEKILLI